MPKNMFQRPQPVTRTQNVPRHGAPLPPRKAEPRKPAPPRPEMLALPPLDVLLSKDRRQ